MKPTRGLAPLADGRSIAYETHGQIDHHIPLLLIRPLGGTMALWGPFRAALAQTFPIIAFDLCGTGGSSHDTGWPSTRGIAADALALLDHLNVPRAHVFGESLGGMSATWLAIDAGDRVAGLVIASAPACGLDFSRAGATRGVAMATRFASRTDNVEARLVHLTLSARFRLDHPDQVKHIEALIRAEPATRTSLTRHAIAGGLHDARKHLQDISAPCLVLAGEFDQLLGVAPPRRLSEGIRGGRFDVVQAAGHAITLEQPITSAARIVQFLEALGGA